MKLKKFCHEGPSGGWQSFEPGQRQDYCQQVRGSSFSETGRKDERWLGMGEGSLELRAHDRLTEVPKFPKRIYL